MKNLNRFLIIQCLIVFVFLFNCFTAAAESVQIPIKLDRHKVIVPTSVNGSKPLNLILDTGMRFDGVYLFHRELASLMDTTGAVNVQVPGAGAGEASKAIMIENGNINSGAFEADSQRVIIAGSQTTQGFPTDGVIGWTILGHGIVEIDYDKSIIYIHDSSYVPADTNWTVVPIEMKKDLPWLEVTLEVVEGEKVSAQVYIDLASGDNLELLTRPEQKFSMPDELKNEYLGTGLSGDIHGQKGTTFGLEIGDHRLDNIETSFAPAEVRSKQDGADGILGNGCIENFNVIFDYYHKRLYLKSRNFSEK